jgi:tRNA (pseudouridine54-N1)-methyltransferase
MRQFVVIGHDAPTTPEFSLDDLPGGAGRLDVLCRCVGAALFLSHGIREDVRVHLVLQDALTVSLDGGRLRHASPDERNLASLLRDAIGAADRAVGHQPAESSPGVTVTKRGLAELLDAVEGSLVQLHESGSPVAEAALPEDPVFVLSDHRAFADREADLLAERDALRVRLGPLPLHAEHAITVAHNHLDTDGDGRH